MTEERVARRSTGQFVLLRRAFVGFGNGLRRGEGGGVEGANVQCSFKPFPHRGLIVFIFVS